ncbi:DUF6191 domain-containing protein [Streptomyces sp. NPDC005931]|uniref:DUF6191 domain-containing protein n=1 Tax=Streptomyces sp. NPDC005931 TaxID=3364737 RepID=UPI00367D3D70
MFNAFEELFAPGRKHTHDERKRLELTREDVGDADPGRGPIDLASGRVVVRPPAGTEHERDGGGGKDQDAGGNDGDGRVHGGPDDAGGGAADAVREPR